MIQDEYSPDDFSFDVEHIGDEAPTKLLKDFDSTLRQFNSMQWYKNLDVIPFVEAIEKMKVFYKNKQLDLFKDYKSLPELAL